MIKCLMVLIRFYTKISVQVSWSKMYLFQRQINNQA